MALYVKQDFSPPILSRRWIAMKCRPNMILNNHHHIISILESGLLFREDSVEVEQECPSPEAVWVSAGGGAGWVTRGERVAALLAVAGGLMAFPPRGLSRACLVRLAACLSLGAAVRACHRLACRGALGPLLAAMRDYLALARRAAACVRECAALRAELGSVSSALESTHTMLCRQQSELAVVMSRASASLLGNAPWLRADVAWDAVANSGGEENLLKIHHAFLVVQSTLLKHIAMAHYIPSVRAQNIYKNHNERIYWLHSVLIPHLTEDFRQNYEALERMYRLLKNYGNSDVIANKKLGSAISDSWTYSEVHSGIARTNLELKLALNKCNNLDTFLDSCALNKQELDLNILNKDVDNLIDCITKSLISVQNSQIRLKKLQNKFGIIEKRVEEELIEDDRDILRIEDKELEPRDEVFYFIKTDEDENIMQPIGDICTGPGKKEKETTKVMLNELRRNLVRREDLMRERERQALVKTMPEFKDNIPEFPRQINEDMSDRKGFISKITQIPKKRSLKPKLKTKKSNSCTKLNFKLKSDKYFDESEINSIIKYKTYVFFTPKRNILTFYSDNNSIVITKWRKHSRNTEKYEIQKYLDSSGLSEGLSDVEAATANKCINQAVNINPDVINPINEEVNVNQAVNLNSRDNGEARNYKFSKKDLELSPSSSDSDFEVYKDKQIALLRDVRRHRTARRKNHPDKRGNVSDNLADESLRPVSYSMGTGLSLAAVMQGINARVPTLAGEEVFSGDGEASQDSGNDEDA